MVRGTTAAVSPSMTTRKQHKWQRLKQTFTPAGGQAIVRTSKSVSGALGTIGGVAAGVQALIIVGALIFH